MDHPGTLVLIMLMAVAAPLLAFATGRWLPVPVVIVGKIEAMGFGFLVPFFYIVTGIEFDLDALLDDGRPLLLLPVFLVLFLVVRGGPVRLLAPRDLAAPSGRRWRSTRPLVCRERVRRSWAWPWCPC